MQLVEGLSDRQAADAVRDRLAWKYALALELDDRGFDASVLCEFRERLIVGGAEALLLHSMLTILRDQGLLKARGKQPTDSTHVLAAIRILNRLECVGETLRHALNALARHAPEWVRAQVPCDWFDRYSRRIEVYRLPSGKAERQALAGLIGADGVTLLTLRPQAEHEALQAARQRQTTALFKQAYGRRAGIEGTLSQAARAFERRRSRYLGEAKTHLQHLATAAAINLVRLFAWFEECPRESRRSSPFAALAPAG